MNRENLIKLIILIGVLVFFLAGSRIKAEQMKVICTEGNCQKPHDHGELNFHERFHVEPEDHFGMAFLKSCANFWEANATGMTFAVIIGGAALSLHLSWKEFERVVAFRGVKGAALGSVFGMPLNMCANCSAVTGVGLTSQGGSPEATLGVILGGALLNIIGIVTMFSLFHPAVIISRLVFSAILIVGIVPLVSRWVVKQENLQAKEPALNLISCYLPENSFPQTVLKTFEDWLIAIGNIAYKLIPLMLIGTLLTALFRVLVPNEVLHEVVEYNPLMVIAIISFIGTMLSVPVLFEILLGTMLLQLGFSNGAIAAMVFTAPSFGLFTLVLTRQKLGGIKVPLVLIGITFLFGIGAGLLAEFLTTYL
ncbi:hypothetical protein GXP67_34910 [Rhodocytophaga rosea]|uniref:Permease n=1 Tax=Rhodocytophaga rosea TaxID=2704465 RepID=A0A6C0GTJ5_9BACT|nr:permease [Rhodocytophaga rosea]QHT71485.1 hypothetical protein GXP67_34910 [Rhodocytophaga rosea]